MKCKTTVGILLMALLVCSGCGNKKVKVGAAGESLPIEVAHPEVRDVTLTKEYPGYLSADAAIGLVGRVNGVLKQSNVIAGQRVKRGDLLYIIEPAQYEDAVLQAEAALKTAEAELAYARSSYERMKEVIKSEAVSEIQLLQTEANVKKCEADVSNAEAALSSARTTLGYCYVKSPVDGQISKGNYSVGAYIPGGGSPVTLATVYKDDRMFSYFNITDNQWLNQLLIEELTKHSPDSTYYVTVTLGAEGRQQWKAKLDYLSPNITLSTGTLEVRAELENPNGLLKAGSYVSITLPIGEVKNGILVSDASIGTDQLGKYLYVVNDSNVVHYRPIQTGQLIDDTLRLVKSGLRPGERYVTKALLKVRDGMAIMPVEK